MRKNLVGGLTVAFATLGIATLGAIGASQLPAGAPSDFDAAPVPDFSQAQIHALEDGAISRQEYEAAFDNYRDCMSQNGFEVIVLDRESTIIEMRIPGEAVERGIDGKCYESEFMGVNESWQIANQDSLADNALLDSCLERNGLPIPTTRVDKVNQLALFEVDLASCLSEE